METAIKSQCLLLLLTRIVVIKVYENVLVTFKNLSAQDTSTRVVVLQVYVHVERRRKKKGNIHPQETSSYKEMINIPMNTNYITQNTNTTE